MDLASNLFNNIGKIVDSAISDFFDVFFNQIPIGVVVNFVKIGCKIMIFDSERFKQFLDSDVGFVFVGHHLC